MILNFLLEEFQSKTPHAERQGVPAEKVICETERGEGERSHVNEESKSGVKPRSPLEQPIIAGASPLLGDAKHLDKPALITLLV